MADIETGSGKAGAGKSVEFLFDFGSPASYLAFRRLPGLAAKAAATLIWTPILLGGVFKATGNASPTTVPAKGVYMNADLARFATRHSIAFAQNPYFPINTLHLMRGAVGYQMHVPESFEAYCGIVFAAIWAERRNMGDPAQVAGVLNDSGLNGEGFSGLASRDDVKEKLKANTEHAVQRGVFGAPTMFVQDTLYFGQDRLDFVAEALGVSAAI